MSETKIPIDHSHMTIQGCTPERKRLTEEVQRALGDGIELPECADVELLEDGSIRATVISENGTVHAVDIYADGEVTTFIMCNPEDSFVGTGNDARQVCENYYSSKPKGIAESRLKSAQAILLKAKEKAEGSDQKPQEPKVSLAKK
ncbi:MAG: hypothetical protein JXA24_07350 [Proteobacteria bacterium]|nr:hypothetical protein [Pseudomonadota bacterium]